MSKLGFFDKELKSHHSNGLSHEILFWAADDVPPPDIHLLSSFARTPHKNLATRRKQHKKAQTSRGHTRTTAKFVERRKTVTTLKVAS